MRVITIDRFLSDDNGTFGILTDNEGFICFTLEPPWRGNMRNISCILPGQYEAVKVLSARFGTYTWRLQDVPGRSDIEFHLGNTVKDTRGCILPGSWLGKIDGRHAVVSSERAFEKLMERTRDDSRLLVNIRPPAPF